VEMVGLYGGRRDREGEWGDGGKGGLGIGGKGERQREGTLEANDFVTRFSRLYFSFDL